MRNNILIACVLTSVFFSCIKQQSKDIVWEKSAEENINKWVGNRMWLPKDLQILPEGINDKDVYDSKLKIVTSIDVTCGTCLMDFEFWKTFVIELNQRKLNCKVLVFVYGSDLDQIKATIKQLNVSIPCAIDLSNSFLSNNHITDKRISCALLDRENRVQLIGSPVLNTQLSDLYFQKIEELLE